MVSVNLSISTEADSGRNKQNDSTSLQESLYTDSIAHTNQFKCNMQFAETVERAERKYTNAISNIVSNTCYSARTKFTKCPYVLYDVLRRYWLHIWLLASPMLHIWLAIAVYSYRSDDIVFMCNLEKVKILVNIFAFLYVFLIICMQSAIRIKGHIFGGPFASSLMLNFGTFICFLIYCLTTDNIETPTEYATNYTCVFGHMQKLNE